MGTAPSAHSVEMENPNVTVAISEDVIQRIRNHQEKQQNIIKVQNTTPEKEVELEKYEENRNQDTQNVQNPQPDQLILYYQHHPTITNLLLQKEIDLKENNEYWKQEIEKLKILWQQSDEKMIQEANDTEKNMKKTLCDMKELTIDPEYDKLKADLVKCYTKNSDKLLMCTEIANQFTKHVQDIKKLKIV